MLRLIFFALFVRPIVLIVIGLNVRRRRLLPTSGPAIIVANHNSHLDTLVLMSLFPLKDLPKVRAVAAADYFLKNRFLAWFSTQIIGILPLERKVQGSRKDPLAGLSQALDDDQILILFPEGSRGDPERLSKFKTGVAHLAKRHPDHPIVPVFLHGLGKVLPRGEALLVPFFCDVFIGEAMGWTGDRESFMSSLDERMNDLGAEGRFPEWD